MSPNERGHYLIEPLGIELGICQGSYQNQTLSWLRWWDSEGIFLLTGADILNTTTCYLTIHKNDEQQC